MFYPSPSRPSRVRDETHPAGQTRRMDDAQAVRLEALFRRVEAGPIRSGWHWLGYNFTPGTEGSTYFTPLTLMALDRVDQVMPGYADNMLTRLEQMGGKEKDPNHYIAIVQWLAELLVVRHLAEHRWPAEARFVMEPTAGQSKKNPEIVIELEGVGRLGVEVKSPDLERHRALRGTDPWQMTGRSPLSPSDLGGAVTLPRDNPVKDFLISSDQKFAGFRQESEEFRSVLFIVWDDYVNEPLSALLAAGSGLLTPNSFNTDEHGNPVKYPNLDAIVLVRHQHQLRHGMANHGVVDERKHFLDYGDPDAFPPHAFIPNPAGRPLAMAWLEAIGAWPLESLQPAAEYNPGELVMWIDPDAPSEASADG